MNLNVTDGQIKINSENPIVGKFSLKEAGLSTETYKVEGGNLRLKVELGYIQDVNFYKMPVIELHYTDKIKESEWIVEFNGENILEKKDHSGQSTVLLLNRQKMVDFVHRHENNLIIHGDFSEVVEITSNSTLNILEVPGE